jgi:predicted RecA/RadA family phage recombinase
MPEATYTRDAGTRNIVLTAAAASGQVLQMPDGRAGVVQGLSGANFASGNTVACRVDGMHTLTFSSGVVMTDGQEVYFDHSANACTYKRANDKDFYVGTLVGDKATGTTSCKVRLNEKPQYIIQLQESAFDHVPVLTAGTPSLTMVGGTARAAFSATAEAQKLDLLSKQSFPLGSKWIMEAIVEVSTNCDADVGDLSIGVANGTHASDFQSVAEFAAFHFDLGADFDLDAQSDDGTTDVNPTDTTVNWAEGTPIHLLIDGRDHTNIKMYVDGVRVLSGTTFTLTAATGPLKAVFHLEKSSNDSPGVVELDKLTIRTMEQATN